MAGMAAPQSGGPAANVSNHTHTRQQTHTYTHSHKRTHSPCYKTHTYKRKTHTYTHSPQCNTTICTSKHRKHICCQSLQLCNFFISRKQVFSTFATMPQIFKTNPPQKNKGPQKVKNVSTPAFLIPVFCPLSRCQRPALHKAPRLSLTPIASPVTSCCQRPALLYRASHC